MDVFIANKRLRTALLAILQDNYKGRISAVSMDTARKALAETVNCQTPEQAKTPAVLRVVQIDGVDE